ncbi:hypothetical protein ACOMHN_036669 [Nucella lapillus]
MVLEHSRGRIMGQVPTDIPCAGNTGQMFLTQTAPGDETSSTAAPTRADTDTFYLHLALAADDSTSSENSDRTEHTRRVDQGSEGKRQDDALREVSGGNSDATFSELRKQSASKKKEDLACRIGDESCGSATHTSEPVDPEGNVSSSSSVLSISAFLLETDNETIMNDSSPSSTTEYTPSRNEAPGYNAFGSSSSLLQTLPLNTRRRRRQPTTPRRFDEHVSYFRELTVSSQSSTPQAGSSYSCGINYNSNFNTNSNQVAPKRQGRKKSKPDTENRAGEKTFQSGQAQKKKLMKLGRKWRKVCRIKATVFGRTRSVFYDTSSSSEEEREEMEEHVLHTHEVQEGQAAQSAHEGQEGQKVPEEKEESATISSLTRMALQDMAVKQEEVTHLSSLLMHYLFGSRDTRQEDVKTDRQTLCLLACDCSAGFPLRHYLVKQGKDIHRKYLDFWSAMRRYIQLQDLSTLSQASVCRDNGTDIIRLLQQQMRHVTSTFLGEEGEQAVERGLLTDPIKGQLRHDLRHRRHTTLINATQDVVANVLSIPVTQYVLHDLYAFHSAVNNAASDK